MTSATDLNFQHLKFSLSLVPYYKLVYVLLSLSDSLTHKHKTHTLTHFVCFSFLKKKLHRSKGKTDCCLHTLSFSLTTPLTTIVDAAEFHGSLCSKAKPRDCCKITWTAAWQRRWWTGGEVAVFALLMDAVFSLIRKEEITSDTWHDNRPWINLTACVIWKVRGFGSFILLSFCFDSHSFLLFPHSCDTQIVGQILLSHLSEIFAESTKIDVFELDILTFIHLNISYK